MTDLICIVCPRGCHLSVDENNDFSVTGNGCPRGAEYGKNELTSPVRTVTAVVKLNYPSESSSDSSFGKTKCCPVKTSAPIPKNLIFTAMDLLKNKTADLPVKTGDIIYKDIAGTGIDWIACRTIENV